MENWMRVLKMAATIVKPRTQLKIRPPQMAEMAA